MTLSIVLEVALGLALIYYVLGLAVSYITGEITKRTERRAKDLAGELKLLLGTADNDKTYNEFMAHPLIRTLAPKRTQFVTGTKTYQVERIPRQRAVLALLDILFPGKGEDDLIGDTRLHAVIGSLPDSETKQALQDLVESGYRDVRHVRYMIEQQVNDTLATAASLYKQHARQVVIVLALLVTLVTGVDSIEVATRLWLDPTVRAALTTAAEDAVAQEGESTFDLSPLESQDITVFWSNGIPDNPEDWVWKIAGLAITWAAVAQGSSFWYNILKQLRSGSQPAKPGEEGPSEPLTTPVPVIPVSREESETSSRPTGESASTPVDAEPHPETEPVVDREASPPELSAEPTDEPPSRPNSTGIGSGETRLEELALAALDKFETRNLSPDVKRKMAVAQVRIEAAKEGLKVDPGQIDAALEAARAHRAAQSA